jgi:hypothetical protein
MMAECKKEVSVKVIDVKLIDLIMDRWQNKFEIKSPSFMSAASRKLMSYNI